MPTSSEKFLPMAVDNIGFLVDRLGQDCHPLQFLRELTQNSIEALLRKGGKGEIVWDMDWLTFELEGLKKLCITDNGDGMTGEELVRFINQLSSSNSLQSMSGNYGVGAKITAATNNPHGVVYISWKQGEGAMIQLYRNDKTGQYGLKQWKYQDGSYGHYLVVDDDLKPALIKSNGTKVVLLGAAKESSTMEPPIIAASPSRWIAKYLNGRYFKFPDNITVKAREGWDFAKNDKSHNILRTLTGQGPYLKEHSQSHGQLKLSNALAHWWILKEDPSLTSNGGYIEATGHLAALYQDELYELTTGRSGMSKLQQFGIIFGHKLVVIYIEPTNTKHLTTNTARTTLLISNDQLPWGDWSFEFRNNMPEEIAKLIEEKAAATINTDHNKAIRERLKKILSLFNISRYKPDEQGKHSVDEDRLIAVGSYDKSSSRRDVQKDEGTGGNGSNVYAIFEKAGGSSAKKITPDPFPVVRWVSIENQTREPGDIEDRAAKYLSDQNILLINADFTAFTDLVDYITTDLKNINTVRSTIKDVVKGWYEQALVETVIGLQSLINRKDWAQPDIDKALSEEALTGAVMQRYHIVNSVKREVGSRMGSLKAIANKLLLMCA